MKIFFYSIPGCFDLEEYFQEVFNQYNRLVYNACYRILRNHHDAEDASQAAFLAIYSQLAKIRKMKSPAGWIYKIAE
jgi:RNA polymerase sigma-70 factor (ECF subfamily)